MALAREMSASAKLCTLMVHSTSHTTEELLMNPEIFSDLSPGDFVEIYDQQSSDARLVMKVPNMPPMTSRMEISLTKVVAEANNLKPFAKVVVEKINPDSAMMDFVELSFKRQYLQRGNFFRFQNEMIGRPIYLNQNLTINGIQAQIQEMRKGFDIKRSGIIGDRTKFVFRSRSARIIWLVQLSAEMWEFDQNGDLYFEKFLRDFVSPLLDKWKTLGVSHMLTVVFFSRTLFLERVTSNINPELYGKRSFSQTSDGFQYQDNFKIVIENIAEFDQTTQINRLRQEFWDYPRRLGWRVPQHLLHSQRPSVLASLAGAAAATAAGGYSDGGSSAVVDVPTGTLSHTSSSLSAEVTYAVPSDAVHGNFLEAINMSLNILSKHYLDRDLLRTNNSIVMVSAGTGVFKVRPNLNQITKQRMLDNAFGIDFISLARPIVDTVPLFLVDCRQEGVKNFYETPHWMRVSYIDCEKEVSEALEAIHKESKASSAQGDSDDTLWGKMFMLQPTTSLLTAQLENSGDLKQLAAAYANTLPLPLRAVMALNVNNGVFTGTATSGSGPQTTLREGTLTLASASRDRSAATSPLGGARREEEPTIAVGASFVTEDPELEALFAHGAPVIPTWGTVASIPFLNQAATNEGKRALAGFSVKSTIHVDDLLALKSIALNTHAAGAAKGSTSMAKNKLREVIEDLPILQRDRGESIAESLGSHMGEGTDEDSDPGHARHTGKFITGTSYEDDERMRAYERHGKHNASSSGARHTALSVDNSSMGDCTYLTDLLRPPPVTATARVPTAPAALQALVEDLKERQSAIKELAQPAASMTKQKLLELMMVHDRNIFRGRTQMSHPPSTGALPPIEEERSTAVSSSVSAAPSTDEAHQMPQAAAPTPAAVVDPATAAAEKPFTAVVPVPASASTDTADAPKKADPPSRQEIMRAKLLGSSSGAQAARQKQLMMQAQLQQQQQYTPSGGNRAMNAVTQQLRAQQLQQLETDTSLKTASGGVSRSTSVDVVSPAKPVSIDADSLDAKRGLSDKNAPVLTPERTDKDGAQAGQSSAASALAKKFQRLSNKSFLGAKAVAAMTAGPRATPEAVARVRSTNPNQQFAIVHGKIVPVRLHADVDAKLKAEQYAQYVREYSQTHCVNPFRVRDSQSYSQAQSHNRRRWVHVFPQSKTGRGVDYSLNWKSLTQPAILPLTTDFVPSIKMMDTKYDVHSSYQLLVQKNESPFATAEDLMKELICIRLTQEYQLIEDFDPAVYRRFNNTADAETAGLPAPASALKKSTPNILLGTGPSLRRMDSVHGRSKEMRNFYILSMGHRIQFMQYDDKGVNVTIYRSKEGQIEDDEKSVYTYAYESWNPQIGAFITMSQSFHKFSSTEFRWNKLDNVVVGNIPADTYEEAMKMKRLKYEIVPPEIYTDEEAAEYFAKIDLLAEFLNKYTAGSDDVVLFQKDKSCIDRGDGDRNAVDKLRSSSSASTSSTSSGIPTPAGSSAVFLTMQTPLSLSYYRKTDAHNCDTAKLVMRTAKQGNPAWLYLRYDKTVHTFKALHLEFHWVVCDSWLIDDMLNTLYRRCQKWGLRICQVPQYYSKEDLNVHPFRALPYLPVTKSQRESIPGVFPSPMRMVEKLIFSRRNGWVFDNEYRTDWSTLAMSVPSYLDRDRDLNGYETAESAGEAATASDATALGAQAAAPKPQTFSSLTQSISRMVLGGRPEDPAVVPAPISPAATAGAAGTAGALAARPGLGSFRKPASSRRLDRQYIFHNGLAVVRVAAQGFLWMQNTSSKVSDITLTVEERRDVVAKNLAMVTQYCEKVPMCYDICVDIVERAMDYAHSAALVKEVLDDCTTETFAQVEARAEQQARLAQERAEQLAREAESRESRESCTTVDGNEPAVEGGGPSDAANLAPDTAIEAPAVMVDDAVADVALEAECQPMFLAPLASVPASMEAEHRSATATSFFSSPSATPHSDTVNTPNPGGHLSLGNFASADPFPLISHSSEHGREGERVLTRSSTHTSLSLSSVSSTAAIAIEGVDGVDQSTMPQGEATPLER